MRAVHLPTTALCTLLLCAQLCLLLPSAAALVMPNVFGSHMVLQRAPLQAKLWGEASAGAKVVVSIDGASSVTVQADASGHFHCELPPHELSWNHTVTVAADSQTLTFTDVAFGDVVLCLGYASRGAPHAPCAGSCAIRPRSLSLTRSVLVHGCSQSNMELAVNWTFGGAETIADSVNHPSIRLFTVDWQRSPVPLNNTKNRWGAQSWRVASPAALNCGDGCAFGWFAATCYYYGVAIDTALQGRVPLGLMQATWGGTWVEEWTRAAVVPRCGPVPHRNDTTGQIWNGMVAPIVNFTTHLTLWYQGSNARTALLHTQLHPALLSIPRPHTH